SQRSGRSERREVAALHHAEHMDGLLGKLRRALDLSRRAINTVDEEQHYTDYVVLADHLTALQYAWNEQRHLFDRRGAHRARPYLGTQSVQLGWRLDVAEQSKREVEFLLRSVFLRRDEQQTLELSFPRDEPLRGDNQDNETLTDLVEAHVAADESPMSLA